MKTRLSFIRSVRGRLMLALSACGLLLLLPVIAASVHLHHNYQVIEALRELDARPKATAAIAVARAADARRLHARAAAINDEALRDVLTIAALAVIAIVVATLVLPSRLLRPLQRLAALVRQAQGGNLRVAAARLGHDEIDELTADLSQVLQELSHFDALKRAKIVALATQRDALLNLLPFPAALVDRDGRMLQASQSFYVSFGADPARLIDKPLLAQLEWTRSELAPALKRAAGGESHELELDLGGCRQRARLHTVQGSIGTEPVVLLTLEPL